MINKKFKILLTVIIASSYSFVWSYAVNAQAACNTSGGEITTLGDSAEVDNIGWCLITPLRMQIKLHYIGLCKTEPTELNFDSVCDEVFSSDDGTLATIEKGAPLPLTDQISIPEGTYTHASIFIGNQIKHASLLKFNSDRVGKDSSTGEWCWSISGDASTEISETDTSGYIAKCGTTPPAADTVEYNVSTSTSVATDDPPYRGDYTFGTTASTTWDVYVLDKNRQRNWDSGAREVTDASYFIGIQKFNVPVVINANTSSVDLGFRLTNTFGLNIVEVNPGVTAKLNHVKGFVLGGFEFRVNSQ